MCVCIATIFQNRNSTELEGKGRLTNTVCCNYCFWITHFASPNMKPLKRPGFQKGWIFPFIQKVYHDGLLGVGKFSKSPAYPIRKSSVYVFFSNPLHWANTTSSPEAAGVPAGMPVFLHCLGASPWCWFWRLRGALFPNFFSPFFPKVPPVPVGRTGLHWHQCSVVLGARRAAEGTCGHRTPAER